jgi:hypothetical protein
MIQTSLRGYQVKLWFDYAIIGEGYGRLNLQAQPNPRSTRQLDVRGANDRGKETEDRGKLRFRPGSLIAEYCILNIDPAAGELIRYVKKE